MALIVEQWWTAGEGKQDWIFKAVFVHKKMQRKETFAMFLLPS